MNNNDFIGIFDSGIGGLSVYSRIRECLPDENILYFADQSNMPYGSKSLDLVFQYANGITEFLLEKGCKIIVIACNTACAAALYPLRKLHPDVLFVGMEPAVKPAAELTKTGAVGVLATEGTFKGDPYAGVVRRFAQGVKVYEQPCTGLAEAIEAERPPEVLELMLKKWIEPLLLKEIDQLALACTHYPLVFDRICHIAGTGVNVIDPAEAIARRVRSLLEENCMLAKSEAAYQYFTSAAPDVLQSGLVKREFEKIQYSQWDDQLCLREL